MIKIIKKFNGITYVCLSHEVREIFGEFISDSYWLECNEAGKPFDRNGDGMIDKKWFICKVVKDFTDQHLESMEDECFS
jgi:hypothetical protein